MTGAMEIAAVAHSDRQAWDGYVERHEQGTFFHLYGWGEAIRTAYFYEPVYLAARRGDAISGVLPLIDVRSPLLGRALVSTAFTVGGGPLADDGDTANALADAAATLGEKRGVQYVEMRSQHVLIDGWETRAGKYAGFTLPIYPSDDEQLNAIPRKRRAELRKALASAESGDMRIRYENDINGFYKLYARSLRGLGTPVFPKRFLTEILRAFPDHTEIAFTDFNGAPVAALVSFYFKDRVLPYYAGATGVARDLRAYDFLYWSVMRRAGARGCGTFDFGRSKIDSGPFHYKTLWGAEPAPMSYQYKLVAARTAPDINPNNPKFSMFSKLWTHLPLPAANALGPILAPNFP